jgi:hypothetical protein
MKSGGLGRHLFFAFLAALTLYAGFYALDRHLRLRRGPWEITFQNGSNGPVIAVNQPALGIAGVRIVFVGEPSFAFPAPVVVRYDEPRKALPAGRWVFDDLMYLPGTVTFEVFGHEIELLPRTLYVNRRPVAWASGQTIELTAADKPASLPKPKRP